MPPDPTPAVWPEAQPFSAPGGPHGALVLHGFTGCPQSMRGLAEAFAAAGFAVELPRLPGHGTSIEDLLGTRWDDWAGHAEAAYADLAGRCERVVVAGLSMGGTLTAWLAARHPELAGAVLVNAAVEPFAPELVQGFRDMVAAGQATMPGIGSDIADPDATELAYDQAPIEPLLSLSSACEELAGSLDRIRCPILILTSPQDHVVPPSNSDLLAARASGPVERVALERSYHVATLDHDRGLIEERAVEFARRVTAGG